MHIGENQGGSTGTGSGGSFNLGVTSTGLSGGNADLMIDPDHFPADHERQ
ncbi:MAG: hypothetical protein U1F77_13695 [Kiritimatiellia bacterium]